MNGNRHLCLPSKSTRPFPWFTEKGPQRRNLKVSFFCGYLSELFNQTFPHSSFQWVADTQVEGITGNLPSGCYFLSLHGTTASPSTIETRDCIIPTINCPQRQIVARRLCCLCLIIYVVLLWMSSVPQKKAFSLILCWFGCLCATSSDS